MAENELLDVRWGRRWKGTRQHLNSAEGDPAVVAQVVCEDALADLGFALKKVMRSGAAFQTLFDAAKGGPAAMRAAVSVFPEQQLARLVRDVCKSHDHGSIDKVAHAAAERMFDVFENRTVVFSLKYESWRSEKQRAQLRDELEQRRQVTVTALSSALERAFRGQVVRGTRRRHSRAAMSAKELVGRSLNVLPPLPRPRRVDVK